MTNEVLADAQRAQGGHRATSRSRPPALAELIAKQKSDGPEQAAAARGLRRDARRPASAPGRRSPSWASRSWPTRAQLREIVRRAIAANPKAVADYKKGKAKAADAIKGAVMRETKGMAKTEVVQQLLMQELQAAP